MKIEIPLRIVEAAEQLANFISNEQEKYDANSSEYRQLGGYYDNVLAFCDKELEL